MNPTDPMKPVAGKREWWLNPRLEEPCHSTYGKWHEAYEIECTNTIRVIEFSAYTEALDRIAILESRASQFESTVKETMRVRDEALEQIGKLKQALEFYSNHESVIKEAYHSNDERQITCVHTFINHTAAAALKDLEEWVRR